MAQPSIFAVNTTGSPITLDQLGVVVPTGATGISVVTDNTTSEVLNDDELNTEVDAGNITLKIDGGVTLTASQSQVFMRQDGTLKNNVTTTSPAVTDDQTQGNSSSVPVGFKAEVPERPKLPKQSAPASSAKGDPRRGGKRTPFVPADDL